MTKVIDVSNQLDFLQKKKKSIGFIRIIHLFNFIYKKKKKKTLSIDHCSSSILKKKSSKIKNKKRKKNAEKKFPSAL
jgi:hypothetical protein